MHTPLQHRGAWWTDVATPPPWLLPGTLRANTLTLLSASSGTGKSMLATALGLSLASGQSFLGNKPPAQPRPVLFFSADPPAWDSEYVCRRVARGLGVPLIHPEPDETVGEPRLWYLHERFDIARAHRGWSGLRPSLGMQNGIEIFAEPRLLIFDALRSYHTGDENDAEHMSKVMASFRTLCTARTSVLLLHHEGPISSRRTLSQSSRGSSVITDVVDAHLVLRAKKMKNGKGAKITAWWAKGRGPDIPPRFRYLLDWSDPDVLSFSNIDGEDVTAQHQIDREIFRAKVAEPMRWADMLKATCLNTASLKAVLLDEGWAKQGTVWAPLSKKGTP